MLSSFVHGRIKSIGYAFAGIREMLRTQQNAKIHLVATVTVAILCLGLQVSFIEGAIVGLAVSLVWIAEALNTAFEFICDVVSPQQNPQVRLAKDIAAGGVLMAVMGAIVAGLLVLLPRIAAILA